MGHSSSLSRSLWVASLPSGLSTVPLSLVSFPNLLRVSISFMKIFNVLVPVWTLRDTTCHQCPLGHGAIDHYPLDTTIQPFPLNLSTPYHSNLERRMWRTVSKALQKSRQMTWVGLHLTIAMTTSQRGTRMLRHDWPLVKPCWMSWIISLSCICLNTSMTICSMIFLDREVKLPSL